MTERRCVARSTRVVRTTVASRAKFFSVRPPNSVKGGQDRGRSIYSSCNATDYVVWMHDPYLNEILTYYRL